MRLRTFFVGAAVVATVAGCQSVRGTASARPTAATQSAKAAETAWTGTVYAFDADPNGQVRLYAVSGTARRLVATTPAGADSCAFNSISVSPDGRRIAWVDTGRESLAGDLYAGATEGTAKKIATKVLCGGTGPVWSADSLGLWLTREGGKTGLMDATTGTFREAAIPPHRMFSPSGKVQAYTDVKRRTITVARSDGTVLRTVAYNPSWAECEGWQTQGLSEDGRYLAVGYAACDPSRMLSAHAVVDTVTGREITLPVKNDMSVFFAEDGAMVIIQGTQGYLLRDGKVIAEQTLPIDGLTPLRYVR